MVEAKDDRLGVVVAADLCMVLPFDDDCLPVELVDEWTNLLGSEVRFRVVEVGTKGLSKV